MNKVSLVLLLAMLGAAPAGAQYRHEISNDMAVCSGNGPAIRVAVNGIRSAQGKLRVQTYRGTESEWLKKGHWLTRIEVPARAGAMTFCVPLTAAGTYAVAVRHDVNANGKTEITSDGGAMSNNPAITIFNLGKPSVRKTAFTVGNEVKSISINMRYM